MSAMLVIVLSACLGQTPAGPPQEPAQKEEPPFAAEFARIKAVVEKIDQEIMKRYQAAKTEEEQWAATTRAMEDMDRLVGPLVEKALALVRPHAQDPAAVEVLTWIISNRPESAAADQAADLLIKHHLKDPKTQEVADGFVYFPMPWTERLLRALVEVDLPRDRKGQALYQLALVIKTRAEFPSVLKDVEEKKLRAMEKRFGKKYLDELRNADVARLEAEALRLFKEVQEKYGDVTHGTRKLADRAKGDIYEIQNLGIGKVAPEISGEDIDSKPMKLSDYRGKVVVLDFWGHW